MKKLHFETLQVHAGYKPDQTGSRAVPIYPTTAYVFENTQHGADLFNLDFKEGFSPFVYSRMNNLLTVFSNSEWLPWREE
jgi:O-acetylhomoserine/O-acetylserine sulfhydrylase-like pyridoxal-dependent enzyme